MPISTIDSASLSTPITAVDLAYTGTLTGGTGVVNLGSGQVYKDASGNVGIGTSSPSDKLHVVATTTQGGIRVSGSVDNVALNLSNSGTSGKTWGIYSTNTGSGAGGGALAFYDGTAYRAIIDSSGNLLVGATATQNGNKLYIQSSNFVVGINGTNATGEAVRFYSNGTTAGTISYTASTVAYNTSSDYRLKEDIAPMTGALAKVAALKPCTYKWKVDGSDGQGFIAHELAEVEAGCVTGEKDAVDSEGNPQYQGIDTSFLIATLTAAIQELKALVDTQAARITALETA